MHLLKILSTKAFDGPLLETFISSPFNFLNAKFSLYRATQLTVFYMKAT